MKILFIFSIILLIFILFIILESIREIRQLNITTYNFQNTKIPKTFVGYKILLISDLHNCLYNEDKIIKIVRDEKPNGVFIAGDLLVYCANKQDNIRSLQFIKDISNYSDVYFSPGNHEMGYMLKNNKEWVEYEKYLLDSNNDNIYFLDNKTIKLSIGSSTINIFGLHLVDGYYKRFIKKPLSIETINNLLGVANNKELNVLIAHNPDYFKEYAGWGADLVLSGHNHGGLLKIPYLGGVISPRLRLFPKYDYGVFQKDNSTLILSGGLGAHSLKIRVNNKPEIVIINFN